MNNFETDKKENSPENIKWSVMGNQTAQAKVVYLFGYVPLLLFSYLNHRKIDKEETTMLELRERSLIELCQRRKEEENNASPRSQSNLGLVRMFCYVKMQKRF